MIIKKKNKRKKNVPEKLQGERKKSKEQLSGPSLSKESVNQEDRQNLEGSTGKESSGGSRETLKGSSTEEQNRRLKGLVTPFAQESVDKR
ncbi:hypothetical protein OSTOST_07055 [Ostertagia ostertagi]